MIRASARFLPRDDLGRFVESRITPAVRASVQASCDLIKTSAQGYAPVRTGALRDSIMTELIESQYSIRGRVGPHVDYADYVEYGTGQRGDPSVAHRPDWPGMAAQPYMRPALDENKGSVRDLFSSLIAASLER